MSRDFIGSKISIITKSQCRYTGTIIGIDAQTSSIVLGNIKCYGVENRSGHSTNGHLSGTTLPIMQFANSDIEDLKIVDDEQTEENFEQPKQQKQQSYTNSGLSSSIHDDPAIVSAVMGSTNQDNASNRLINNLQQLTLNDQRSKNDESRIHSNSGLSWSKVVQNNNNSHSKGSSDQQSDLKNNFFDSFLLDKTNNNKNIKRSSNTHSTQTFRDNNDQYDDNGLRIRQPFFSDDQPYPQKQYQQNRNQNGNNKYQQNNFYNNRRPFISNHQRRNDNYNNNNHRAGGGGGNRETFQNNPNDYDADFDFETNNQKFNKITNIDGDDHDTDFVVTQMKIPIDSTSEYPLLYDKKKSFFDNLTKTENNDLNNRSKNKDTFGNDGFYQQNNRSNTNGYRRTNRNYRQGNNDFNSRQQNNNGYYYRY